MKPLKITIDGPAASGKGTASKNLSEYFNIPYLPTGNIFRSIASKIEDDSSINEIITIAKNLQLSDLFVEGLNDEKIALRASKVAELVEVREQTLIFQKNYILNNQACIIEGRDIGVAICPEADIKFFMTASVETRAMRRFKELQNRDFQVIYEVVLEDLKTRDFRDSNRLSNPMQMAEDAILIDSSDLTSQEVFEKMKNLILQI